MSATSAGDTATSPDAPTVPSNSATDALRLTAWRWGHALLPTTPGPLVIPVASWVLLAWSRFGAFVLTEPRAFVGFVLIGVYGWLGLGLAMWLLARLVGQRPEAEPLAIWTFFRVAGYGHVALLLAAFAIAFVAGLLGVVGIGWWIGVALVGVWMPVLLAAGVLHATGAGFGRAAAIAVVPHLLWLVSIGRWAADQLSHLL